MDVQNTYRGSDAYVEKFWANFKRNIRKVIKKHEHLCNAITDALIKTLPG
ncbi:hypothetical protein [Piscirickettsia salmonis]|nr:hypothetical protein [Piscirickettsia salmonis]